MGDGRLGARCDRVVEHDEIVERAVQPGRIALLARGQCPVRDVRLELREAFRQRVSHYESFFSLAWYAATVSRITEWNCRINSSWSLRKNVSCARVFCPERLVTWVLTSC